MVIVLHHTVIAAVQFYRNPARFLLQTTPENRTSKTGERKGFDSQRYQTATLPLFEAADIQELKDAVKECVCCMFTNVSNVLVYFRDPGSSQVNGIGGGSDFLPKSGVAWDCYQNGARFVGSNLEPGDPLSQKLYIANGNKEICVVCEPVLDSNGKAIAVIILTLPSALLAQVLTFCDLFRLQVAACYRRILKTHSSIKPKTFEGNNAEGLVKLCGDLYDNDAASLQIKVLNYVKSQTNATAAFLLLVAAETQELFCQVIADKVLDEEIRFPGPTSYFGPAVERAEVMRFQDIPLDKRKEIDHLTGHPVQNLLCVPVKSKLTDEVIALVCVANKMNGTSFNEEDIRTIQQCFQFTATVITNTIAFQNERKLKNQTQALLQVARNLFTHLGELIILCNKKMDIESLPITSGLQFLSSHIKVNFTKLLHKLLIGQQYSSQIGLDEEVFSKLLKELNFSYLSSNVDYNSNNFAHSDCFSMRVFHEFHNLDDDQANTNDFIEPSLRSSLMSFKSAISSDESTVEPVTEALPDLITDYSSLLKEDTNKITSVLSPIKSFASCKSQFTEEFKSVTSDNEVTFDVEDDGFDKSWPKRTAQLTSSSSDTRLLQTNEEKMVEKFSQEDTLGTLCARLSSSEPTLDAVKLSRVEPPKQIDSQSKFNDAFLASSSKVLVEDDVSSREHKIIIEDTDNQLKHTLSIKLSNHHNNLSLSSSYRKFSESDEVTCSAIPAETFLIATLQTSCYRDYNIETKDLTMLLREIMQEARNLTQAERCSVFLIDNETDELVAKVFDGFSTDENEPQAEIRLPINQGIAGQVATTGQLLNIKDAYSHALFYRGVDESTGFRTRNILSFPIKDDKGVVLGVAQLCNKKNGPHFTSFDEDIASAFAVYCCISISHCLMYQKLQLSQHRSSLANELMFYHMQISMEELLNLIATDIPSPSSFGSNFKDFSFSARSVRESDTPLACVSMFEDLGFIARYRIKKETLARFVLMVKKGYRNPPYHNWMHAFSVAHFCYLLIKNLHLHDYLQDIELFALFVSSLCHDIDHRGTNNSFQVASKSVLAALYSSEGSVLERHHFAQSMCIINTEGCNIYETLSSPDYQRVLDLMREIILATDLGHHLRIVKQLEDMSEGKLPYKKEEKKCRNLLLSLLMTCSDLGDQTKSWDKTKHIAPLIYQEFFSQGDLEKSLGHKPIEMMDRDRARIPDLQIGFLDHVASPVYKILSRMFPVAKCTVENVETNKLHWKRIQDKVKAKVGDDVIRVSVEELITLEREDSLTENDTR